ncbi:BTAD domain-containing putative transcriptional regulator [Streptomyces sp. NPDC057654]|uniref:AfsR/SARP family transcriptional regulator n=1 Tax=Streptomyces sp. NPDC057654 TaxID=3346196 RepID=UPI0036BAE1DD
MPHGRAGAAEGSEKKRTRRGAMVELLALGSLELWHHEQQHALGSVKERCVLAILIHARGELVSVDSLLTRVWDDRPPPTGLETLHTYLSRLRGRLRRAVGDLARVERPSPRLYRLRVDPKDVDLLRFQRLRADADAAAGRGEREAAIGLLRTAETLWRGDPLTEFTNGWAASSRARLIEDYRRVREERIRLELELGRHADLIGELHELAAQNPLAQRVIAQLMLALYRSGRHDEALSLYRTTRRRLHVRQGIEPGSELRDLHQRILAQDAALTETVAAAPTVIAELRSSLPRDIKDFTGRASELRTLLADPAPGDCGTTALPLTVLHGMPGIGKTALAVHVGYQLRASYPDGQFYVDLRAYSGQPPYDPAEALAVLLHASGEPAALPDSLDERAAKWREWTARHRALVILDNARDAAQVSPLLPGSPTCRAIVTSRNRLPGLDGAASLFVDVLSESDAAGLFTRIAGASRVSDDATALGRVVAACGRHPLAVQLLASRFRHRGSWDLRHLLDRLAQAADSLDEFDESVAKSFQFSYAELSAHAQRLFRRMALHPGPDIAHHAATALAGPDAETGSARIRRSLDELLDGHLLDEPMHDRYKLHDLVRAFGLQVCSESEPSSARREAVGRLFAYYLTAAHRADRLINPHRRTLPPPGAECDSPYAPDFADAREASAWLTVERANILAVARAAGAAFPAYAALFPHVLARALKLWGAWDIAAELYGAAVPALRSLGDRPALARALVEWAEVLAQKSPGDALEYATEALAIFQSVHDTSGCADAHLQTGRAHLASGHGDLAFSQLDRALTQYGETHDRFGEAECLNVQGAAMYYGGRHNDALDTFRAVLRIREELCDVSGLIKALNNVGEIHALHGRHEDALDYYERSRALVQQHGGRQELAILDTNIAAVYQATGQTDRALASYQRALNSHRSGGDALGEANALIGAGTVYIAIERWSEALWHFTAAEEIARSIGNAYERQRALIGMADAQRGSGRLGAALEVYQQALRVAEEIRSPLGSAHALAGLARTSLASHSIDAARRYGAQAVTIYQKLEAKAEEASLRNLLLGRGATGS